MGQRDGRFRSVASLLLLLSSNAALTLFRNHLPLPLNTHNPPNYLSHAS